MTEEEKKQFEQQADQAKGIIDQAKEMMRTHKTTVEKIVEKLDPNIYEEEINDLSTLMGQLDKHIRTEDMIGANGIWIKALEIIIRIQKKNG